MLYNIPGRTGTSLEPATVARLLDCPNVVSFKAASGTTEEVSALRALCGDCLAIYSGDDALTLPLLAIGAVGVVGVATHWAAPEMIELFEHWHTGDVAAARRINNRLIESYEFETSEMTPNPIPTKAMLRVLGHRVGQCRLPLGPAPDGLEATARAVMDRLEATRG
jgi:4-hydroxy-tetrahydrodipicolinate synthase